MITINNELSLEDYLKFADIAKRCRPFTPWEVFTKVYSLSTEVTSDFMSGINLDNKRVLTVGSSLDQLFAYAFLGSNDITIMDANNLIVPYFYMKLAAINILSREDYINFFLNKRINYDTEKSKFMDKSIYLKFKNLMPQKFQMFWDELYNSNTIDLIFHFYSTAIDGELPVYLNSDDHFDYVKSKINNLNITINVCEFSKFPMFANGEYSLIDLSNIYTYVDKNKYWSIVEILGAYLEKNGIYKLHYGNTKLLEDFCLFNKKPFPKSINNTDDVFILWQNDEMTYKTFHENLQSSKIIL